MAQIPNKVASLPFAQQTDEGDTFARSSAVTDLDGAPIDLSTWSSIGFNVFDTSANDPSTPIASGTAVGNADGTIDVKYLSTLISSYRPGTYQIAVVGENVAGDGNQLLATGQLLRLSI